MSGKKVSAKVAPKSAAKRATFKPKTDPFTPDEIIAVHKHYGTGFLSPVAGNQTEAMAKFDARYDDLYCKGFKDGKELPPRPLTLGGAMFENLGRAKAKDDGNNNNGGPNHLKLPIKILLPASGQDLKVWIEERATKALEGKHGEKSDEENKKLHKEKCDQLMTLYKTQLAVKIIADEWKRSVEDEKTGFEVWNWERQPTQVIVSGVQYDRKWNKDFDKTARPKGGMVPLEEPISWFRIRANKVNGEIWANIFERVVVDGKPTTKPLMFKTDTGKLEKPNIATLPDWLNPGSMMVGNLEYKICYCMKGGYLHHGIKEVHVRRSLTAGVTAKVDQSLLNALDGFDGNFDTGEEPGAPERAAPAKKEEVDTLAAALDDAVDE